MAPTPATNKETVEQNGPEAGISSPAADNSIKEEEARSIVEETPKPENNPRISRTPTASLFENKTVHVVSLLDYIRSTFDDETVLDGLPLDAA
ncbi:hypothetical protein F66182_16954, partial [Fusarium sp. NRRL 66182]